MDDTAAVGPVPEGIGTVPEHPADAHLVCSGFHLSTLLVDDGSSRGFLRMDYGIWGVIMVGERSGYLKNNPFSLNKLTIVTKILVLSKLILSVW